MLSSIVMSPKENNDRLLTEREGRTGEYWPEVVPRPRANIPQYGPSKLVSCLLYGPLFLIVKCTSGGLDLKMFVFFIHL